jgi:hypothetical protein
MPATIPTPKPSFLYEQSHFPTIASESAISFASLCTTIAQRLTAPAPRLTP